MAVIAVIVITSVYLTSFFTGQGTHPIFWAIAFSPFPINFTAWALIALRGIVVEFFWPKSVVIPVIHFTNMVVSAFIVYFLIAWAYLLLEPAASDFDLLLDPMIDVQRLVLVALAYAIASEAVHHFFYRIVMPVGSPMWLRVTEGKGRPKPNLKISHGVKRFGNRFTGNAVTIGKLDIDLSTLTSVEAQGNYVKIYSENQELFERASFRDTIDALPVDLGIQLHRSRWVTFSSVTSYKKVDGVLVVTLKGDVEIKVARTRTKVVLDRLKERSLGQ